MARIKITNRSNFDISFLKKYADRLKPFLDLADGESYPFHVVVIRKKDFYDRSFIDVTSKQLILKIDTAKQSEEEIAWVLVHEFAHFLCLSNPELKKTCLDAEQETLEKILQKVYKIDSSQVHEIFHDFLPVEVFANGLATIVIGKFYKRHPFENVKKFLKKRNGKKVSQKNSSN